MRLLLLIGTILTLAQPAGAASPQAEIDHLLAAIAGSSCAFIRNGSDYDGPAAADHIRDKYEHFREEIATAEDFIARAASKSLMSGEPYLVRCGDAAAVPATDWLSDELAAFRATQP